MIRTTAATALVGLGLIAAATTAPTVSAAPVHLPAPIPTFTFTSHLETLLVEPRRLTRITGAEAPMSAVASLTDLVEGSKDLSPGECGGAFEPARRGAYDDSGFTGVAVQIAVDGKPGKAKHMVTQAVISFADVDTAFEHLNKAAESWAACGGRTVTYTTATGEQRRWRLGEPELRRDKTVLAQMQTGRNGSCERVMSASAPAGAAVIADVMVCDFSGAEPTGQAEAIAVSITSNAQREQ